MSLTQSGGMELSQNGYDLNSTRHSRQQHLVTLGWTMNPVSGWWHKRARDGAEIARTYSVEQAWQWEVQNAATKAAARHAARPRYHWGLETALSLGESA